MCTIRSLLWKVLTVTLLFGLALHSSIAQSLAPGAICTYHLVEGSRLIDDCPICDRVPIVAPLRGTYDLRLIQQGPLFFYYALDNISFKSTAASGLNYTVTGHGLFQIGGEVATQQSCFLEVNVDNGYTNRWCYFTNNTSGVTRLWPMMQINLTQTNGTFTTQYYLDLNAAPFREIWFSTTNDFAAGLWNPPTNVVRNGDLISSAGRVVKNNQQLTQALGIMPPVPTDLGLKDIDILPGGEIAFSIEQAVWSERLGALHPGDLLSSFGGVLRTNQDLVAAFGPASTNDLGLAAVQVMDTSETWFSVQTNFYSKTLRTNIGSGDLLSERGAIISRNAQLLAPFAPVSATNDFGLASIYVWPSREIWFTTATDFDAANSVHYAAGDLLSDQGYLVYRGSELLSVFAPPPGVTNVALDALFITTDVLPNSPAPILSQPRLTNQPPASLAFQWRGTGRVFQLEKATNVAGPYAPASPITPDTEALDPGAQTNQPQSFYRVHQW